MKKFISYFISLILVLSLIFSAYAYYDVADDYWAAADINGLSALSVMDGYPGGGFMPESNVTRAELAKLVVRAFDIDETASYDDVSEKDWFYNYVSKSGELFLFEREFKPNDLATREEIAYALFQAFELNNTEIAVKIYSKSSAKQINFIDKDDISAEYNQAIYVLYNYGVINGYENNTFLPKNNVTRAETATLLRKALSVYADSIKKDEPTETVAVTPSPAQPTPPVSEPAPSPSQSPSVKALNYFVLVKSVSQAVNENNETISKIVAFNEGEEETIEITDRAKIGYSAYITDKKIFANDLISFTRDYFGTVINVSVLVRLGNGKSIDDNMKMFSYNTEKRKAVFGHIYDVYRDVAADIRPAGNLDTAVVYGISKNANIYILKDGKIKLSDVSELAFCKYNEGKDRVLAMSYDDELKEILIIN